MKTHGLVADIPLLSATEADVASAGVHAERAAWRQRHEDQPFFTLGAASYLDATQGRFEAYQALARETNSLLSERFADLLERLREAVSAHVGEEARYDERLALPGFHVYLFHPAFRTSRASIHYDLQYELIDWATFGTPDFSAQLSLTLALRLPSGGGGLLVWNINRHDLLQMSAEAREAHSRANRQATRTAYSVGHLAVHSGHQLHQIAPAADLTTDDERITLQAHALPVDGRWLIYW